jgi:hypothetical protein
VREQTKLKYKEIFMFSGAMEAINAAMEASAVKQCRDNSKDLKEMRKIALTMGKESAIQLVKDVDNAYSFSKLLELTEKYDFQHAGNKNDSIMCKMKRTSMNTLLFLGKKGSDQVNMEYHTMHFREEVIACMAEKGYMPDHSNTI